VVVIRHEAPEDVAAVRRVEEQAFGRMNEADPVDALRRLDPDTYMRVRFEVTRGRVQKFVVQSECQFGEDQHPIVRYDTAHSFAHRHLLHPSGEVEKTDLREDDFGKALNFAISDIVTNWGGYRRRYERWLRQKAK